MSTTLKNITVFCGSSNGSDPLYKQTGFALGEKMANENIGLIYGGASIGVMGAVADGVLSQNGKAIGVIPQFLCTKEIAHERLTELVIVDTMHERKMKMNNLADGFIMLPGGIGTLEEFFEILTWAQLGLHQKPIAILNVKNYYDDLIHFIQTMVNQGFLKQVHRDMIVISDNSNELIELMRNYVSPIVPKIISGDRT